MNESWIIAAVVVAVVLVLIFVVRALIAGVPAMFSWAGEAGPLGCMAMLALWIFAFPVMLVLAILFGTALRCAK